MYPHEKSYGHKLASMPNKSVTDRRTDGRFCRSQDRASV